MHLTRSRCADPLGAQTVLVESLNRLWHGRQPPVPPVAREGREPPDSWHCPRRNPYRPVPR